MTRVLITGTAGFIGFHLARVLLAEGMVVTGYDGMTDYYDVGLKRRRHGLLLQTPGFSATEAMLEDLPTLMQVAEAARPDIIVHLAAQAGVRYSLEKPRAYLDSNVTGTFHVLEAARSLKVRHLLIASTSSAYGASTAMPFKETDAADHPLTIYAATKRAGEAMSHAYAHLHALPTTLFRFFTVYGSWGRPDMALFRFVSATLRGEAIDIYNHGDMARDFTHVADLVRAVRLLMDCVPEGPEARGPAIAGDTLSPVAPWRLVNIGNGAPVRLTDFVDEVERALGVPVRRNFLPMQKGDVPATWADTRLLRALTGFAPQTAVAEGVREFVDWYRAEYRV